MNTEKTKLMKLYSLGSKHSNYQMLSNKLSSIISSSEIEVKSRYEIERLNYILNNIHVNSKSVLDIGGNTGFFTFEMLDSGAKKVHYYEGNKVHAEFVKLSSKILDVNDKVDITNDYFIFESNKYKSKYDIVLLLNILHHIGDDYGDKKISIEKAKETIIEQLNSLSTISKVIIFQLGFNWKGNRDMCLFENGTKREMIDFVENGTINYWEIIKIGIAESQNGIIRYCDLNNKNISRNNELGEFLNRPIFIMKSLR